jgi:hypothetical protein
MRRVGELSPADWPRVFHGVRWEGRGRGLVIAAGLIAALLCSLVLASSALAADSGVPVVVVGKGSARAVKGAGGKVTHRVRLIDGVIAKVPARSVRAVRRARGVRSVVVDRAFKTRSDNDDADALLGESAPASDDVPADATTLAEVRRSIGADRLDASGDGVDVALIDSGITPVGDLAAPAGSSTAPTSPSTPATRRCATSTRSATARTWPASSRASRPVRASSTSRPPTPRASRASASC